MRLIHFLTLVLLAASCQQKSPNPITGCGYRIEEIDNVLTRQVRYLDKLADELAKGRKIEKILRQA